MQYDEELARMRAQMLAKQDEEPPVFDDGARYLGQDPNMMPVGWFGRPKKPAAPPAAPPVNLQRRSILGLTPMPADLPAVIPPAQPRPTPQQIEQAVPQQQPTSSAPSTAPSASPLQSLADKALNAPMSRRDVLQRAGQVALQQVVPMPSVTDVVPQVMSPLTEAVTTTAATAASGMSPAIASVLRNMLKERLNDVADYGEEEIPETVEKYLKLASGLDPNLKKDITRELNAYNSMFDEDKDVDMYDDIKDAQQEFSMYLDTLADSLPGDKAWQELTGHMEFEDYLNENGAIGLAKQFRKSGATKDEVLDFLDTYYEGFDPDDTDFTRSLNRLYARPLAPPKQKAKPKGK
jgi:hypothetical protein